MKGEFSLTLQNYGATKPFIFDFGQWRLGKRDGKILWKKDSRSQMVSNQSGSAWLRKDELMAKATELATGHQFELDSQQLITHFNLESSKPAPVNPFKLNAEPGAKIKVRGLASSGESADLCQAPAGQFEQCAWKCFGSKNKKSCDTSNLNTKCVRFTCSASGEWKLPTFSAGSLCDNSEVRVGSCQ